MVNAEYGYYLRDSGGDDKPDKSNSYTRSGEFVSLSEARVGRFRYDPPDEQDWVVLLEAR